MRTADLTAFLDQAAVRVAGHQVAARGGRVWLALADPGRDGDLSPAEARALAAALVAAAGRAERIAPQGPLSAPQRDPGSPGHLFDRQRAAGAR